MQSTVSSSEYISFFMEFSQIVQRLSLKLHIKHWKSRDGILEVDDKSLDGLTSKGSTGKAQRSSI